jgi:hypothetical protein
MKKFIGAIIIICALISIQSCEKDAGKKPNIAFKTGAGYISADASLTGDSMMTIGITASKSEDKDVLKKFNISRSYNGKADSTLFEKDLTGAEGDNFSYDLDTKVFKTSGTKAKYTFTVTNRDGLIGQISLTVTTN